MSSDVSSESRDAILAGIESDLRENIGASMVSICEQNGITLLVFCAWRAEDDEVDARFKSALEARDAARAEVVGDALLKKALKGDVRAQIFLLCNMTPERWRPVNRIPMDEEKGSLRDLIMAFEEGDGGSED